MFKMEGHAHHYDAFFEEQRAFVKKIVVSFGLFQEREVFFLIGRAGIVEDDHPLGTEIGLAVLSSPRCSFVTGREDFVLVTTPFEWVGFGHGRLPI
jgi:hypothetical protein